MKILGKTGYLATLAMALLACAPTSWGQAGPFTKYGPVAGIQKSTGLTYVNTAVIAADVTALYSGCTNSAGQYLASNNTCQSAAGAVLGANPTGTIGLTTVNGSATTYLRSDGAPALSQAISPTMTGTWVFTPSSTAAPAITINAPAGKAAIIATGAANSNAINITGSATSGQSFGLNIAAGTTSADAPLTVTNQSGSTTFLKTFGDGGTVVGSPTGGDKGAGSLNATALYVGGVAVGSSTGTVSSVTAGSGLTASPNPVIATGTVSLDLTSANTWTGNQTFRGSSICENNSGTTSFTQCELNVSSGSGVPNLLAFNSLGTFKGAILNERTAGGVCVGDAVDDMCVRSVSGDVYVVGATRTGYVLTSGNAFSLRGVTVVPTAVATTIFTIPNNGLSSWFVTCGSSGSNLTAQTATSFIVENGTTLAATNITTAATVVISVSGLNVQCTQTISASVSMTWGALRWGP